MKPFTKSTIEKVYRYYEKNAGTGFREHLGASIIGDKCLRKQWYAFRWCCESEFSGRILRLFDTGIKEEQRLIDDLGMAGCEIYATDPKTGRQFQFETLGGHFGGSMDACVKGLVESDMWHVGEFKTHNEKSFSHLKRHGVKTSKPSHHAQMMAYMGLSGMIWAYYLAVNKNTDELYDERVAFAETSYFLLIKKAEQVIMSPVPLQRYSDDSECFECRYCQYRATCHDQEIPQVNCRTCRFSCPDIIKGGWHCKFPQSTTRSQLDKSAQESGCRGHVFIPELVPFAVGNSGDTWIEYDTPFGKLKNGGEYCSSREIKNQSLEILFDRKVMMVKSIFNDSEVV